MAQAHTSVHTGSELIRFLITVAITLMVNYFFVKRVELSLAPISQSQT